MSGGTGRCHTGIVTSKNSKNTSFWNTKWNPTRLIRISCLGTSPTARFLEQLAIIPGNKVNLAVVAEWGSSNILVADVEVPDLPLISVDELPDFE